VGNWGLKSSSTLEDLLQLASKDMARYAEIIVKAKDTRWFSVISVEYLLDTRHSFLATPEDCYAATTLYPKLIVFDTPVWVLDVYRQ